MWSYLVDFFTSGSATDAIVRVFTILCATVIYFLFFYYAKKRNMQLIIYISVVSVIAMFALTFLGMDNLPFYAYFLFGLFTIIGLLFFVQDFRRDIFRLSLKHWIDKEKYTHEFGREDLHRSVQEITKACQYLSRANTGALIVVADSISDSILESGTAVNSEISAELIETLFFPKAPLHDGAVVIIANKVVAAGCYLPLTQEANLPREFGTRHRAAMGVTEMNPGVTAIVVSEETGIISAMRDGKVKRYLDAGALQAVLDCAMRLSDEGANELIWGGDVQ